MMIMNKLIEEYLENWMMTFFYCKDIEDKISEPLKHNIGLGLGQDRLYKP